MIIFDSSVFQYYNENYFLFKSLRNFLKEKREELCK